MRPLTIAFAIIVCMCLELNVGKAQDITTGLMLYFDFEGISSSNTNDVIQDKVGSYNGVISGSGILHNIDASDIGTGNALSFDGTSHLDLQNSSTFSNILETSNEFTLSAWVKPSVLSSNKTVISLTTAGRDFVFKFYDATLTVHHYNVSYKHCGVASTGQTGIWQHILCTYNSGVWKVYYNGQLIQTCDFSSSPILWESANLDLGAMSGGEEYSGIMDEMRVYNRALTDADVTALYNYSGGSTLTCSSTISTFPYTESFETNPNTWENVSGVDDIDWTRQTGSTSSSGTGPTTAQDGSYYYYTEASSNTNKTAILSGPCFNLTGESSAYFSFWYHMYGTSMGSLVLEASTDGTNWTALWNQSGDQGDLWQQATVNLSSYIGSTVHLRFKGTTGSNYSSDMAIDNLSLTDSPPTGGGGITCQTTITTYPYSESYETNPNTWENVLGDDDIDWTRQSGSTPSSSTGPTAAQDGSYYYFTESSVNGTGFPNKTAILSGPCFDLAGESSAQFSFYYHMYGTSMGSLVLEASTDGTNWTSLWSLSGDQGNSWQQATVNLSSYVGNTVQLRFLGTTGSNYYSDMAIDNLALSTSGGGSTVSSVNSYTGDVQLNLSLTGDDLSISGGNTVSLPYGTSDITEISAGTGLSGGGSAGNVTLDANSGSALWNANKLQDSPIAITVPSSGQVLKWNGSAWAPATDETDSGGNDFWLQNGSDIYFNTGNVGIGTTSPDEKLTVNGKIHAKEVIVDLSIPAPDYVFDDEYKLRPMSELENFVIKNSHLPDIPPAKEMEENGIDLSLINMMLLKRIEELTLYIIDQEKRIKSIESLATPQK
jgi:hypothetical protein